MAHRKAGGSAKNLRDSNPKYLGTKLYDGETAQVGSIIVRQRGTKIIAGQNVGVGKDHTLFALADGMVKFDSKRKTHFNGKTHVKKRVNVIPAEAKLSEKKTSKKEVEKEAPKAKEEKKEVKKAPAKKAAPKKKVENKKA